MDTAVTTVLWAMLAFQIKHFICDFVLQNQFQVRNKGIYGHPGGFIHAGLHAIGSLPALLILGAPPETIAILLFGEFVVHYHVDWFKARFDRGLTDQDHAYWVIFGLDQLVHQLTYLAMTVLALRGL
ncbi:MAG TPA: DUF3307 domain-containing protein [Rhizomicrobium sp.]|nr:DUF3307 domain-containing protein [Rhizomicrobium sp.]